MGGQLPLHGVSINPSMDHGFYVANSRTAASVAVLAAHPSAAALDAPPGACS
jgi:hypothetical protein